MVIWVVGQPACLVPRPPLASSILQLWVAKHTQTYHHGPRYLSRLETAPNNHLASKLLNRKSTCIKSFCHMMNYDTSLCSQHVYSLRAPIIRNIWLFRRYVSYLALSNSTDVDSRDNSECTHTCVFVRDVWYEMCVLIPSSVIWTCGSSSPADFIISTRLLCALLLCLLSVCNVVLWILLCCLLWS